MRLPAENLAGLRRVGDEQVHFRGTVVALVHDDVLLVVQPDTPEGDLAKLPHGVGHARADDKVVGLILLQHAPHGVHVIAGEAPVALGLEVAEAHLLRHAKFDARHAVRDFAGDEFLATTGRFMVEQDARYRKDVERLAVIDRDEMPVDFRDPVWTARIERRAFALRHFQHLAKHLAGGGLIEASLRVHVADGFEDARHANGGHIAGQRGLVPRGGDKRLRGQVVDFVGLVFFHQRDQRTLVMQVALNDGHVVQQVLDALVIDGAGAARHPHHFVAFGKQKFGEVRPVLSRDPCDNGSRHVFSLKSQNSVTELYRETRAGRAISRSPTTTAPYPASLPCADISAAWHGLSPPARGCVPPRCRAG